MENFEKVKEPIASVEADAKKFYENGSASARTRVRKGMQELKTSLRRSGQR